MKTCRRFARIAAEYEREFQYLRNYADRDPGTPRAKASANKAHGTKRAKARALSTHFERCRECG
ncbi:MULTISPECIES: hypothetical protein [unclassified Streptomyces]|uniref:hypothetical protein n=1 Tax=unclassified Streptomyces TaxID=2593676 RepID=UPI0029B2186A|nr:hypothetical protein [Streptomyces sp. AK02-01A]MDX3854875.1 hypothetical protein [Streptomyces sp. AK02-01A]